MNRFLSLLVFWLGFATAILGQNCFTPDLSELEIMCNYENPFDLAAAAGPYTGSWTVEPQGGNVFVYSDYLYYTGAYAGQYTLKFTADDAPPTCPSEMDFAVEVITTAFVWPVPTYICEGDSYVIGDSSLTTEDLHDVWLPGTHCDSLVTVFLLYYDVCPPEESAGDVDSEVLGPNSVGEVDGIPIIPLGDSNASSSDETALDHNSSLEVVSEEVSEAESETNSGDLESPADIESLEDDHIQQPVFEKFELLFPTAFSPDGNGFNDSFGNLGNVELLEYSLSVYNRWGNEVFHTTDINHKWRGTSNGNLVPGGVYFFSAKAITLDQQGFQRQGSITLLR